MRNGRIWGVDGTAGITISDPTARAEILALREAGATSGHYRPGRLRLGFAIEPALFVAVAPVVHSRIRGRLVYGRTSKGWRGAFCDAIPEPSASEPQRIDVRSGVLAGLSADCCIGLSNRVSPSFGRRLCFVSLIQRLPAHGFMKSPFHVLRREPCSPAGVESLAVRHFVQQCAVPSSLAAVQDLVPDHSPSALAIRHAAIRRFCNNAYRGTGGRATAFASPAHALCNLRDKHPQSMSANRINAVKSLHNIDFWSCGERFHDKNRLSPIYEAAITSTRIGGFWCFRRARGKRNFCYVLRLARLQPPEFGTR